MLEALVIAGIVAAPLGSIALFLPAPPQGGRSSPTAPASTATPSSHTPTATPATTTPAPTPTTTSTSPLRHPGHVELLAVEQLGRAGAVADLTDGQRRRSFPHPERRRGVSPQDQGCPANSTLTVAGCPVELGGVGTNETVPGP